MFKSFTFLLFSCLVVFVNHVKGQSCPDGWSSYNNKCYFFSHGQTRMSWYLSESWCAKNGGHLTSFATVEERDWALLRIRQYDDEKWWIGLNDNRKETVFEWNDGTPYDPEVADWKLNEPNNAYQENCVEVWNNVGQVGKWNDRTCEGANNFVCKRDPGDIAACPDQFTLLNGRCYWLSTTSYQWLEAEQQCKALGANLVSVSSSTEQSSVVKFLGSQTENVWAGLSDTSSPGTLQWVDGTPYTYTNFVSGQTGTSLPYIGSTCTEMVSNSFSWSLTRCGDEKMFVCERGLKGDCPLNWIYNSEAEKCYDMIINPSRVHTWSSAKKLCAELGAGMLKIESENEEVFVGAILDYYSNFGHPLVYIGASDIGHDNQLTWWDQSTVAKAYWAYQMPQYVNGRDDCVALYSGQSNGNWETVSCYEERPYVCEIPEGKALAATPIDPVDGKCNDGWRHFREKCYFFGNSEQTQADAENFCKGKGSHLASVLNSDEISFIIGHITKTSWIGLEKSGSSWTWIDNEVFQFTNWFDGEPNQDGNCVSMNFPTGEWSDQSCSIPNYFVCKMDDIPTEPMTLPPPTYIPDYEKCGGNGWISDPSSDRCYKVNYNRRIWQDAEYECKLAGGQLAAINSPQENEHIKTLIRNNPSHEFYWLGGNDLNNQNAEFTEHGWEWTDKSAFNYINWASGEPNNENREDCMDINWDGEWFDIDCFYIQASICEKQGNVDNIVGDPSDENCASNSACCFKHTGAEYGGKLPDSAMSASTERDQWFTAERGRLNTPSDVIIISAENEIFVGNGHGGWSPNLSEKEPWLQVDFGHYTEVKGIITQGRNSPLQGSERQWVRKFKVSFTNDENADRWQFIADSSGQQIVFDGNSDQNTQITNLFPRPVLARMIRCHPVDWNDAPVMRLEYIGCRSSCLHKLGMNSGLISDTQITASSSRNGKEPINARAPVDNDECLPSSSDNGANYRGWISRTKSGKTCQAWASQSPWPHDYKPGNYPDADLRHNYCRNPDPTDPSHPRPWCFTTDTSVNWEECEIPVCPTYIPSGWVPSVVTQSQYVQVAFDEYFEVSGVTVYKPTSSSSYVKSYYLSFSDNGVSFITYTDPAGSPYLFSGVDSTMTENTDILRERISTKYVRVLPQAWSIEPVLQFELHGCYAGARATCIDSSKVWSDESNSFSVSCPTGCVEDFTSGAVYGTDIYTADSAVCPAAVHAGALLNKIGGIVNVQVRDGMNSYTGTYSNGIQSENYGHADASFAFQGDTLRCADGWLAWQNHCYYVSLKNDRRTWYNARSHCISMGGDLGSILSNGENSFIEGIIYQAGVGGDVWIGLNDLEVENYYQWADGSPVTITKWFWDEPKAGRHRCVNIYRFEAYWNDKDCDETLAYICKKEKELLPPVDGQEPVDEGCEEGWKAFGSSCYQVSETLELYDFANVLCGEKGATQVALGDEYEQAFVHSLSLTSIPPGLDYTIYIGMTATTVNDGPLEYSWETGDPITYTHWDENEPEIRFSCAFPFQYEGQTFDACTTYNHPGRLGQNEGEAWCSIDPVYNGRWINCGSGRTFGCGFLNDQTGHWEMDLCSYQRYYVCEKDRIGYTQPQYTTPSTAGSCAPGWYGDSETTACYQINEKSEDDRIERLSWDDALAYCRAQGGDLASIHSYEQEQKLISFVQSEGVYSYVFFWVGLIVADSDAGYVWTDGSPVDYTNWNYGEPNNHNGKELCVEAGLTYGTMWNDLSCDSVRNFICQIAKDTTPNPPPTTESPPGTVSPKCGGTEPWVLYTTDYQVEKCYLFVDSYSFGWNFAQNNCTAKGGNLVAIHSDEENSFVLSWAARSDASVMWIGLKDMGSLEGRSFQWSDGSTLDYINWGNGEPNNFEDQEDCAEMVTASGLWNDDNCGTSNGYICEKFPGAATVPPPPTPTVTGGCPPNFIGFGNKCYWFSSANGADTTSWDYIVDRCADLSSYPATIQNPHEQAFVTSQLKGSGNAWVGLSAKPSMEYVWFDQSELSYTNWDEFEPNGYSDYDGCVYLSSSSSKAGKWADEYCYDLLNYVCYTMKSSQYPEGPEADPDCMDGYIKYDDACYLVMNSAMTRSQAAEACQNEGSDVFLTDISDVYENNLLRSWLWKDLTSGQGLWTGLTFKALDINGGKTVVYNWDNGWPIEYTSWALMQPDNDVLAAGSGCIRMDKDGNWVTETDSTCEATSLPFVCKKSLISLPPTVSPGDGTCDNGFFPYGDYCYYVEKAQLEENYRSWHDAQYYCELRSSTLASLHSEEECTAIITAIDFASHNLFIGLSSDGFTGWKWDDGSPFDFSFWQEPYEPNGQTGEDCVEMYPWNGKWNDISCLQKRGYICKKPKELNSCSSVDPESRYECGYIGIEETVCYRRSCCWDPLYSNDNFSGCYHPYGVGPSGIPITDKPGNGGNGSLDAGAIVGIIAGLLGAALVIGGAVYCIKTDKAGTISMPSISAFSSSNSKKSPPPPSGGFDNPIAGDETMA